MNITKSYDVLFNIIVIIFFSTNLDRQVKSHIYNNNNIQQCHTAVKKVIISKNHKFNAYDVPLLFQANVLLTTM